MIPRPPASRSVGVARVLILALAAVPLGAVGCGDEAANSGSPQQTVMDASTERVSIEPAGTGIVEDEIVVKFRRGVDRGRQRGALERVSRRIEHLADKNGRSRGGRGPDLFDRLARVVLKDGVEAREAARELAGHPDVEYVEPNFVVNTLDQIPNDPSFSQLWGLHNTGQTGGTPDDDIDAPAAWDLGTGSAQVVVAVIDTGIDYRHPDLTANVWVNSDEIPGNNVDDDGNGYVDDIHGYDFFNRDSDPLDDHFHGTHVSGTIGGVGNNGVGVAGVCWTVRLMGLKFLGGGGSGDTGGAISAIQYAINNGAHVMSNSWGGGAYSQALQDAITAAYDAGIVFVAAAGNSNTDLPMYPAACDHVITVSAVDHNDMKASFSNYGLNIDVAAPGVNVFSTKLSNTYGAASGTSMACPHVSGLAALLKSRNAMLTVDQVESVLKASADDRGDPGWDTIYGAGRINAHQAMQMVDQGQVDLPTAIITSPVQGQTLFGTSVNVVGTAGGIGFASFTVEFSGSGMPWTVLSSSNMPVTNDVLATFGTGALADGSYILRLTVTNTSGLNVYASVLVTVDQIVVALGVPGSVSAQGSSSLAIEGSAYVNAGTFDHYVLEFGVGISPTSWSAGRFTLAGGGTTPVVNGLLGTFDLSGLDGFYKIRLTAFSSLGSDFRARVVYIDPYLRAGWPVLLGSVAMASAAVGNLDGANGQEVLISTATGVCVYDKDAGFLFAHDTQDWFGNPIAIDPCTAPALAQLAAVPGLELAFLSKRGGRLYAANQGTVLPGFYVSLFYENYFRWRSNSLMASDLNGDGNDDLILPTARSVDEQAVVYARDRNGAALPGFPFVSPYMKPVVLRAGAVADVDGDGHPEIFFTVLQKQEVNSLSGIIKATLFGLNHQGGLLPGFPMDFNGFAGGNKSLDLGDIAIGDINGDGRKEIVFCETARSTDGALGRFAVHAIRKDGSPAAGWPWVLEGAYGSDTSFPAEGGMLRLGDVTGDDVPEIIVSGNMGTGVSVGWGDTVIRVLRGDGSIAYTITNLYRNEQGVTTAANPFGFSVVDLNGDQKGEILLSRAVWMGTLSAGGQREAVIAYDGTTPILRLIASPVPDTDLIPVYPVDLTGAGVVVTDVDEDGHLDIVSCYRGVRGGVNGVATHTLTYVWSLPNAFSDAAMEWPAFRGNRAQTGEYISRSLRGEPPSDTMPPAAPALVSPSDGSTTSDATPTFDWTDVTDPSGVAYRIQVDNNADFSSPAIDASGLASSTYTSASTLATGGYSWRVRAVDGAGNAGAWSAVRALSIAPPMDTTPPAAPALVSPANGSSTSDTTPTFDWADVMDPSGVAYRIQVDNNVDFSSAAIDASGLASSTYTPTSALAAGGYSWRVRAVDGAGNAGAWSAVRTLSISAPPPSDMTGPTMSFLSPLNGQTVSRRATVSVSASDPSGVAMVQFFVNGVLKATDTAASWSWTWNTRSYRGQTVTLSARGIDSLGNATTVSIVVTVP
ncbi:MAG: S8 family serine peptidase [Planctomycetes bacterium]|nr:S8 family serine peptidase [Planctomycetota bacterium]